MQENSKLLYRTIGLIIDKARKDSGINYTDFCYGNEIPMSTYDTIISGRKQSSAYNIAKVLKALNMSFEEFGKRLDETLPKDFLSRD